MNIEQFVLALREKGIELNQNQLNQFNRYHELLVEWNSKMNLTNILDKEDVYLKHFYDSITLSFYHDLDSQSICDIGAGAGFPSIPLKIIYPNLKIVIVDSLNKRITFLNHLIQELKLTDVLAVAARAEEYAQDHRESFDIVTARAVARLNILDELCLPLVKKDGYFISLKGSIAAEEIAEARKGISILGGEVIQVKEFMLPKEESLRVNVYVKKVKDTPKSYPRPFAKIKKQPL